MREADPSYASQLNHNPIRGKGMTIDEASRQIDSAIGAYGSAAGSVIERILGEVKSEVGQEAVNSLIESHDLELLYNITPNEFDIGSD